MAESGWLVRHRAAVYPVMNIAVSLGAIIGAVAHDQPFGVAVYVSALVALCSAPLLLLKRLNDRYVLLAIFMALYFLYFGALDLQTLLFGTDLVQPARDEFLTSSELAILTGAAATLVGCLLGVSWGAPDAQQSPATEWPAGSLLVIGLALWLLGTAASIYYQIFVVPTKLGYTAARGLASLSPILTFIVMLGQLMQPVGILMLAYGYAKYGRMLWTPVILVVVATQVAVGFLEDIKAQAIMGGVLVIMTRVVVTGRLPKAWIASMAVFLIVAFPVFQAYRVAAGERGLDRAQALEHLDKMFEMAVSSREKVTEGHERSQTFLERSSSKGNIDLLFRHVGQDVPYLYGSSLIALPLAFVPRLLVPDKEDISVGMLFGKQILKEDSGVYISISHLGELYWNFGWPGVIFGMLGFGVLLGFLGAKFNLEQGVTLTRVLVLLATVQPLCLGFGGTIPVAYSVWMRSIAAIGLMHLIFARVALARTEEHGPAPLPSENVDLPPVAVAASGPRFPNLLR